MIVVTNSFLPASLTKHVPKKDRTPIATTETGDSAYYVTHPLARVEQHRYPRMTDDDDSDDDEDDEMGDEEDDDFHSLTRTAKSLTGAKWRPNFTDRMTMFIAGAPGAGKSYLAKEMINLLPDDIDILLFTALEEKDGNFEDLGKGRLYKIKMTPETLGSITLAEIRARCRGSQAILLFDDVDKIRDPKVQNCVFALMNDALANGRGHEKHDGKGDIHVICTSHSANDYQKTKYTFENSNYVALFPGTTPPLQMYRMFDKLGLEKTLCQKMMRLGRKQVIRSIIVHKVVPMYMIFGDKIMLL